ncbi:recombinase family protein [Planctomyces sp. SH-PL62]|uniref:recombinase family protein n=1 Tax=Planctomyces sp. SH-PL62 TaxID=1636152 RepID=UPI00078E29EE|nr:recombinase family protein [Planctomyces sp. SH-PL62]AMV40937.1 Recombinase [Planctomyces sp. SH-PL62]
MDEPTPDGDAVRPRPAAATDTDRLIDELVVAAHRRTPQEQCGQVGAIYARYSTKAQGSVGDQVRSVLEAAARLKIHVPREFVFYDEAVSGSRNRRPGLDRLRATLARRGAVQAVLVFATNRLGRTAYHAMQIVHEEMVGRDIRCVFTSNNIDTADGHTWQLLLQAYSMVDQMVVASAAAHIHAAHEAMFDQGLVHGAVTYGYRGREVGEGRGVRKGRPLREYEIDPEAAPWILRAFEWYAREGLSIGEVVRRLNAEPRAPRNPRLLAGWDHAAVRRMLGNPRYRGHWMYGETKAVCHPGKASTAHVRRDAPLKSARLEHLRIVPEDLWLRARARLAEGDRRAAGRKPRDGDHRSRPRALAGLFHCGAHGRRMQAGGGHGKMLICKDCMGTPRERRSLCSILNRRLALKLTCEALALRIRRDDGLATAIVAASRSAAASLQSPDPAHLVGLRTRIEALTRRIGFVMDNPGAEPRDVLEAKAKLQQLRRERSALESDLGRIEADAARAVEVPDEGAVREMLSRLGATLDEAAGEGDAPEDRAVREVVDALTGGRVDLFQEGGREPKRGWLRGSFRFDLERLARLAGFPAIPAPPDGPDPRELVRIDYREPAPCEAHATAVKALYDEGVLVKEIAARLGISRNLAAKALAWWHRSRDLEPPDGRSRRSSLPVDARSLTPPLYVRLADEALRLSEQGLLYEEVAARLGCDRNTAAKAIKRASELRGTPAQDGRSRRKTLDRYRRGRDADAAPPGTA